MNGDVSILAFLNSLGWPELMVIGVIALLIFGKRLPEVGRSLGRGIVEFKKGLRETEDEIKTIASQDTTPTRSSTPAARPEDKKTESV